MIWLWQQSVRLFRDPRLAFSWAKRHVYWWGFVFYRAIREVAAPETALVSAAIGYFTLFSLFPLMLLVVAIASIWFDPMWAESEVVTQLEFVAPALGDLLGSNLERIVANRGPITSVAALILLWSGSNIFNVLTRAVDRIWEADLRRSAWRHRGIAILMVLIISFVLIAAFFAEGTILTILNTLLPGSAYLLRPFTTQLWAALVSVVLFALLYNFLPHVRLTWRQVLPGALFAGLLWELAKRAFLAFIGAYLSRSNLVYGSVTTIIVFLTWVYFSSTIFLFGAYVNKAYYERKMEELRVLG